MLQHLLATFVFFTGCTSSTIKDSASAMKPTFSDSSKILIVYLSRTGNTEAIAKMIQRNVGGNLVPLELENPYPENYQATVQQVVHENETGFLPSLKTKIDSMQKYELIFIGFPTWDMKMPPPMKSFLTQYNLQGKTIIPFNTNAGYGLGNSISTLKELCPKNEILEAFEIRGGIEKEGILLDIKDKRQIEAEKKVKEWLNKLGLYL